MPLRTTHKTSKILLENRCHKHYSYVQLTVEKIVAVVEKCCNVYGRYCFFVVFCVEFEGLWA